MKLRRMCLILAGIVILSLIAGPATASDTIKFALIEGLSGPMGAIGGSAQRHVQYAAEVINARGGVLGGRSIEIVPFDTKGSVKETLIQLKNAIDRGFVFILNGNGASPAGALINAINKHNKRNPDNLVVFFNYSALTPAFTEENCSFYHFRFDAHTNMKIAAYVNYIKDQADIKKVYLINQDYVWGHTIRDSTITMLKQQRPDIEIVGNTLHPIVKVKDFSPYIAKIQASGADAVITGNWGPDINLLVKAGKSSGLDVRWFTFWGGGLGCPAAIGGAGEDKLMQLTEWHNGLCIEENKPEDEKYYLGFQEKYSNDGKTPFFYGRIHTMMEMVAMALEKAGEADPVKVAFALEDLQLETDYGTVTMRGSDHQLLQPLFISTMTRVGNQGVKYDVENTGLGWKTNGRVEAEDTAIPSPCKMKRPQK